MKAIEFKNVFFKYDRKLPLVLNDVSFSVDFGSLVLLSGASGSGKSTILSLISGIIPNVTDGLIKGEILLNGRSVLNRKLDDITKDIGITLQNADSQIIQAIVADEIAFGCENIGMEERKIEEKIKEATDLLSLDPSWRTRTLSGGQKQRLITASILAMGQKILVLDEPLANLDYKSGILLLKALKRLSKDGYAVLLIEHRLDMVLPYVDKIHHVENGKVSAVEDKKTYLTQQSRTIESLSSTVVTDTLLSLNHISYKVKDREILKDISFTVKKGEKVLLLGENGCGKTTLEKLIAKLIKPTRGEYHQVIDPKTKRANHAWFSQVGVIYQNPNYQLFMPTVQKELEFSCKNHKLMEEVIQRFNLSSLLGRHPQSLSEGQKRKVTVASILASNPSLILLDEPTVGQDYAQLNRMVEVLNLWHERFHNTMITITHDIRCAEALCDKAIWIKDGKVYQEGGKETIRSFFSEASGTEDDSSSLQ